jgi:hypothetical protein
MVITCHEERREFPSLNNPQEGREMEEQPGDQQKTENKALIDV